MKVIGIDPGSIVCGYGVIEKQGNKLLLIEYGVINAVKIDPSIHIRIKEIFLKLNQVVVRNKPDIAVLESTFYSKNAQSLMKLSYARAAAILASTLNEVEIAEYSPREVKKSVTGNGNASKEQVQYMVKTLLSIDETPEFFDATDALAAAICHTNRGVKSKSGYSSWNDFVKKNPERIAKL